MSTATSRVFIILSLLISTIRTTTLLSILKTGGHQGVDPLGHGKGRPYFGMEELITFRKLISIRLTKQKIYVSWHAVMRFSSDDKMYQGLTFHRQQ